MTFDEFKATGEDVPDLRAFPDFGYDLPENKEPIPGRVYHDDCLFIVKDEDGWSMPIGNCEYADKSLEKLERILYDWSQENL